MKKIGTYSFVYINLYIFGFLYIKNHFIYSFIFLYLEKKINNNKIINFKQLIF